VRVRHNNLQEDCCLIDSPHIFIDNGQSVELRSTKGTLFLPHVEIRVSSSVIRKGIPFSSRLQNLTPFCTSVSNSTLFHLGVHFLTSVLLTIHRLQINGLIYVKWITDWSWSSIHNFYLSKFKILSGRIRECEKVTILDLTGNCEASSSGDGWVSFRVTPVFFYLLPFPSGDKLDSGPNDIRGHVGVSESDALFQ